LVTDISIQDVRELGMIRCALEGLAAELAASRMDVVKAGELQSLLEKMGILGDPPTDESAYLAAHRAFHLGLYEAAGLPRLSRLVTSLWEASERYRRACTLLPDRRKEAAQEHRTILEACRMKDGPMARHLMEGHLSRTTEMTIELLSRRT
jgi:DNA-binding GntR family transcriptional regulator